MIYFDNSATTHTKPDSVVNAVVKGLTELSANPGRSGHKLSLKLENEIFETRQKLSNFFNNDKVENVIFTQNCTDALNMAINGTVKQNGHIILTAFDHNSTIRPISMLEKQGKISKTVIFPDEDGNISVDKIRDEIKPNTYLICVNAISNVDGSKIDIEKIGKLCREKNILFLVDGAQACGHIKIDMQRQNINLLAIAPHKGLYSPQGVGVLMINHCSVSPTRFGGTGTDSTNTFQPNGLPEALESGTLSSPCILGLKEGLTFVENNFSIINNKIETISKHLYENLLVIKDIKMYTRDYSSGIICFNLNHVDSQTVANILNENYNICVRAGLHCAPLKHQSLGTISEGAIRVSLSYFNELHEIDYFIKAIKEIQFKINSCKRS